MLQNHVWMDSSLRLDSLDGVRLVELRVIAEYLPDAVSLHEVEHKVTDT